MHSPMLQLASTPSPFDAETLYRTIHGEYNELSSRATLPPLVSY